MTDARPPSNVAIATDFLRLVCAGRVDEAYDDYVGAVFRHHNPWFRGDAASLREGMAQNAAQFPEKRIEFKKTLEDGDQVMVMSLMRHAPDLPAYALVHVFRFAGGRIVELWDVAQEIPAQSRNDNGMF
jgi:predicted SnoaL-like aldol condensation-catalyzing enzyme